MVIKTQIPLDSAWQSTTDGNLCPYCNTNLPGPCRHEDPCPNWEDYKESIGQKDLVL